MSEAGELKILKRNILSSYLGQTVSLALGVFLIPLYLHLLGVEAYGLIGFFTSLQIILQILDFGISSAMNRELARQKSDSAKASENRQLVFTLQFFYALMGCVLGVIVCLLGTMGAGAQWLNVHDLHAETIQNSFILYGIYIAVRWPSVFYGSVLRGLEHQVLFNAITVGTALARAAGVILVLVFVSQTLEFFLILQIVFAAIETGLLAFYAWRVMPAKTPGVRFRPHLTSSLWNFAAAMTLTSLFVIILRQTDKIYISRLLPLNELGFYSTAGALSGLLAALSTPLFYAIYPRFSSLLADKREKELINLYRVSLSLACALTAPAAGILIFFPDTVLLIWTRSVVVADEASRSLALLSLGSLLNSLMMTVPHALQLASHRVMIPFLLNLAGLLFFIPGMHIAVSKWGVDGAAGLWAAYNVLYYFAAPFLMKHYQLPGAGNSVFLKDTAPMLAAGLGIPGVVRIGAHYAGFSAGPLLLAVSAILASAACVALCEPLRRRALLILKWKKEGRPGQA